MAQEFLYKALLFFTQRGNALFEWYLIHKEFIFFLVRSYTDFLKGNATLRVSRDMGRSNRRVIPLGPITVRPMHQPASVVANTLCCKLSCSPCRRRRYRKCAVRDSIRFYNSISILFHLACLFHDFPDQPTRICPRKSLCILGAEHAAKSSNGS